MHLKLQTIKISQDHISTLQSSPQDSGIQVHKLNEFHTYYKFVLSRCDTKSTRFVEQAISATTNVCFMNLT